MFMFFSNIKCRTIKLIATTFLIITIAGCSQSSDNKIRLATGPQGGSWYPLGGALKTIIENNIEGTKIQVLPGAGVANAKAIESGKTELALANSVSTVDAINGKAPFSKKSENICNIASLYPQYFQIVVGNKSGITNVKDIAGKVLAGQGPGNTAEVITRHLLAAEGIDYEDLQQVNYGSYTDSVALMKDANADIFTLGTTIPAGAIMDLSSVRKIKLLEINDQLLTKMKKINPGYLKTFIPASTYRDQNTEIQTIGYTTHLICRCDLNIEFVYNLIDDIFANIKDLATITKVMEGITPEDMNKKIGVPLHPGARNWYKEKGAM